MESFKKIFGFENENNCNKLTILYIIIAYLFSIAVRYIYIQKVGSIPAFLWQHHLMINNNDGYYWAEGARDILAGFHQKNDLSPVGAPAALFTAYIAKMLPFVPFDVLIEFLPGFIGSLIVIPVILIGKRLGSSWLGFLASLLSGIAWSYYNRTMFGYYDTDMLIIVLPTFAVWAVMWSFKNQNVKYFFWAPLIEIIMTQWHSGLFNIANGIFIMTTIYVIIFHRKEKKSILFLSFLILPLLPISLLYKIIVLFLFYSVIVVFQDKLEKNIKIIAIILGVFYALVVGYPWIHDVLINGYFTRATISSNDGLKYFDVINTVRETSKIDYNVLVHRISGSWTGLIIGVFGYILLSIRFPVMLVSLPMVVLGFFAVRSGLRFTIFAVPFMALGDAYIVYLIGKYLSKFFIDEKVEKIAKYLISLILMLSFVYPNYKHDYHYLVPTVFTKYEVQTLNKLKHMTSRNDYVMSWWDYGYPIRYYANVKTFVDGGKHSGDVDYPASFALMRNLQSSRNISILDAYFTEYNYDHNASSDYISSMMKRYNIKNPNKLISLLSTNMKLPKIKENIYYYLPFRMFNILPTISLFSNINLKTGKEQRHFFFQSNGYRKEGNVIALGDHVNILLNKKVIIIGNQEIPIHYFAVTEMLKNGKLHKSADIISNKGLDVVFMKSYNKWLIMDDFYFNSTFIQLFVFENTGGFFKPVIINPYVKVFKVVK